MYATARSSHQGPLNDKATQSTLGKTSWCSSAVFCLSAVGAVASFPLSRIAVKLNLHSEVTKWKGADGG